MTIKEANIKMKTITLTEKEYSILQKIKKKDPQNKCHHNWYEFLLRCARSREKEKL